MSIQSIALLQSTSSGCNHALSGLFLQVGIIEKAKTDRTDKPLEDIKIVNIDVLDTVVEG